MPAMQNTRMTVMMTMAEDDDETGKGFAMSEASLNYLVRNITGLIPLALLLMKCGIILEMLHVHSFLDSLTRFPLECGHEGRAGYVSIT